MCVLLYRTVLHAKNQALSVALGFLFVVEWVEVLERSNRQPTVPTRPAASSPNAKTSGSSLLSTNFLFDGGRKTIKSASNSIYISPPTIVFSFSSLPFFSSLLPSHGVVQDTMVQFGAATLGTTLRCC